MFLLFFLSFINMFGGENDPLMIVQQLRMFGQWEQAKNMLDQIIDQKGEDAEVILFKLRGECYVNLDMPEEALEDVEAGMRGGPDYEETKNLNLIAATAYIKLGMAEEAKNAAQESGDHNMIEQTNEMEKILTESDKLYEEEKYEKCGKILDRVLTACTHATSLVERRLEIAWILGQSKVYEEKAKELVERYSGDTELQFRYGVSLMCNGKFLDGKRSLLKVQNMEDPPSNLSAYSKIATSANKYFTQAKRYTEKEQFGDAEIVIDKLNSSIRTVCNDNSGIMAKVAFLKGKLYAKQNMTDESLDFLNKAIEVDQENFDYIHFRADFLLKMKEYDAAIFDYTRLQRMRPQDMSVNNALRKAQEEKKKANAVDYYAILNVTKDCSQYEIKEAFRKLVRKWHPDRYPGKEEKKHAEDLMKKINTAYDVLNNPGKRKYYDMGGDMEQYTPGAENMMQGNAMNMGDISQILRMFTQGGAQQGAGGQQFIIFQQ